MLQNNQLIPYLFNLITREFNSILSLLFIIITCTILLKWDNYNVIYSNSIEKMEHSKIIFLLIGGVGFLLGNIIKDITYFNYLNNLSMLLIISLITLIIYNILKFNTFNKIYKTL